MYHITVAGHLITNLRLRPLTIMKIFTGTITNQNPSVPVTIYGVIRAGQNAVPGSYSTTTPITVTLTYQ